MSAERPFVDRAVTDGDAARRLAERVASQYGLGRPVLVNMGMNAVFRCGPVALRVSHLNGPAASAYDLADSLTAAGVRVARASASRTVDADAESDLVATTWEYVESTGAEPDWYGIGEMVALVRGLTVRDLPDDYPVPLCTSYPWWRFDELLADVGPLIDDHARDAIRLVVDEHRGWVDASGGPEHWVLCHGDVHPHNVIAGPDGPVIIDWDLLCLGPPGWDHAPMRSMVDRWGASPAWRADFERGDGLDLAADPVTASLTTLRLVAATLMRLKAGRHDDAAAAEAERRLRYWRGDPSAPIWLMS